MSALTDRLAAALLGEAAPVPTGALGRLGRTAGALARGAGALLGPGDLDEADLLALVRRLGRLRGVAMKAGQILSYVDVALPAELREALAALQTAAQALPADEVRRILEDELGAAADPLLAGLEDRPVAAASIGQVHRATLPDGARVAVKVQYPGIEAAIRADFAPAAGGKAIAAVLYPGARIGPMLDEARARFLEECDYGREAETQARFGALLSGHAVLRVPAVHRALSSRRVLTTEFVDGVGLEGWLATAPAQAARDRLGAALFEFYVGTLLREGAYVCDPHPGNYLVQPDGRLAVLDYGCARTFERPFVLELARLTLAAHADDRAGVAAALAALGVGVGPRDADLAHRFVRGFFGPMLRDAAAAPDVGEARAMRELMATKRELMRLHLPGEFLFLLRIRFGLVSVLARLGARVNWFRLEEGWALEALERG
ncbi:MAG: AarF/ABC1/UbiB kinase family protein [Anaeromyxobacter sp.]